MSPIHTLLKVCHRPILTALPALLLGGIARVVYRLPDGSVNTARAGMRQGTLLEEHA